jgi:hypothetical protein
VAVDLSGKGFDNCESVVFRFDGVRIGSAEPDSSGAVQLSRASIPGDAKEGSHRVTAGCGPKDNRAIAQFRVTSPTLHRSSFVSGLPHPWDVSTKAKDVGISMFAGLLLIALVAFPAELFNSTLDENYAEVRSWFRRKKGRAVASEQRSRQMLTFGGFLIAGGLLYALLSPDFGLNLSSLALVIGFSAAIAITTAGFGLPANYLMKRHFGEGGRLGVLPGTLIVSIAFVGISRLLHLQPGLIYGLVAGFSFRVDLDDKEEGRLTAVSSFFVLVICLLAWLAQIPLFGSASAPDAKFWVIALEACLAGVFVIGLESLMIGLLPLRFMRGLKVARWSRIAWLGLVLLTVTCFVHILVRPTSGFVSPYQGRTAISFMAFCVLLAVGSIGFWAYFRFRPEAWVTAAARRVQNEDFEDIVRF